MWGGILALSAPIAHDLGAGWAFLLVRGSAVAVMLPIALAVGAARGARLEWWRVAIWGVCDALAYFAFVVAADHGPASVAGVLAAQFGTVGAIVAVAFFGEPCAGGRSWASRSSGWPSGSWRGRPADAQSPAMTRFHELPDGARLAYDDSGQGPRRSS